MSMVSPLGRTGALPRPAQWAALVLLSAALALILIWLGIPAALLLGPLAAGIVVTASGGELRVPRAAFLLAQGLLGCMIAGMLPGMGGGGGSGGWLVFVVGVVSVVCASGLLGWLMTRLRVLPGATAVWGMSPGAATAMTIMAEAYGADAQLVAFMQYLRVVLVAAVASCVAAISGAGAQHAAHRAWFPPVHDLALAQTLVLATLGPLIAARLGFRAGGLLVPLVLGIALTHISWMTIELPPALLAVAYAVIGWQIGLRFTRRLLVHAAKALPRVLAGSLALIAICGGIGMLLARFAGVDPLTAYLATSPGGADTAAIIAASSHVDVHFVMTMQMARLIALVIFGPPLARFIAERTEARERKDA